MLKREYRNIEETYRDVKRTVSELEQYQAWDVYPPGEPYGSLDRMLEVEIGISKAGLDSRVAKAAKAREEAEVKPGPKIHNDVMKLSAQGNNSAYLLRRLARSHPDILAGYERGEYLSVRSAAKAAGIIRTPTKLEQVFRLLKRMCPNDRRIVRETLERYDSHCDHNLG